MVVYYTGSKIGVKNMTIHDIARLAGVSAGTVSNVLNHSAKVSPKTEEKVWKIIEEVNYVPNNMARGLKSSNTRTICIISEDINAFPAASIVDGICEFCREQDYHIVLSNLRIHPMIQGYHYDDYLTGEQFKKDLNDAVQQARALSVCGILYVSIYPRDIQDILPKLDIPVTYCYAYSHGNNYCVNCDDFQGGKLATDHLIAMGHSKIGLLCGVFDGLPTHKRLLGYQTALMENSIPYIPEYIIAGAGWSYEDGYRGCQQLLDLPEPPTAIFAMCDHMAYGAMNAAHERGLRIPEDLSIHGYDNMDFSPMAYPALSTVAMPLHDIGREGARIVIDLVEKRHPKEQGTLLACTHIPRDSVAPPKE